MAADAAPAPIVGRPDRTGLIYRSPDPGPGLHVLLVGISAYPFLVDGEQEQPDTYGLGQLDSAARTAGDLAAWLLDPPIDLAWPIRTIRLVASPSPVEAARVPVLAQAMPATLTNLKRALKGWRLDANSGPDGATLFYYAGHGIQRTRGGSTLLLGDFLDPEEPVLTHAIDFNAIYDGMGEAAFDRMARTQLFFVDACRADFAGIQTLANAVPAQVWDITEGGRDERVAPVFYGASAGQLAFGSAVPGGISAFGRDIMSCLAGSAADLIRGPDGARWTVTIGTLADAIAVLVAEANRAPGRNLRSFMIDRWTKIDTPIVTLRAPPAVACRFTIGPPDALPHATITLDAVPRRSPMTFGPPWGDAVAQAPAGGYIISAALTPGCPVPFAALSEQIVALKPPFFDFGITFTTDPAR
jgi:hypothetical protein